MSTFKKNQTVTIKSRGAAPALKQYAGHTMTILRGGKNVSMQSIVDAEFGISETIKVPAEALATSVKKTAAKSSRTRSAQ